MSESQLLMCRPNLDDLPALPPLPPGYTLRPYAPADCPVLAALLQRAFEQPWDQERVRRNLVAAADVEAIYVIAYEHCPVATASARVMPDVYPGSGYIHWVATDPDHAGKRLGWLVSLCVLHHFRCGGLRDAVLETDDWRLPAIHTYLRLGFIPVYRHAGDRRRWSRLFPFVSG